MGTMERRINTNMCAYNSLVYIWLNKKLTPIDQCIASFILQLNQAGIKTTNSCCGHGKGYPNVICAPGTEEALENFGCKIIVTRKDNKVEAYFPAMGSSGHTYAYEPDWRKLEEGRRLT